MAQPLSKAGQLFFVATHLMTAPLVTYARLRDAMLPKSPYQNRVNDLSSLFDKVIYKGGYLEGMPFELENTDIDAFPVFVGLLSGMADVWAASERLYQLKRIAEGVNQPTFVYLGYLYLIGHILELYATIMREELILRSPYRDVYADFKAQTDDCVEKLADAIFQNLTNDKTLPNWAHHKLSKETYPLALDWQRTVKELAVMPMD